MPETQTEHAQTERRVAEEEEFEVFVDHGKYGPFGRTFGEAVRGAAELFFPWLFHRPSADTMRAVAVAALVLGAGIGALLGLMALLDELFQRLL